MSDNIQLNGKVEKLLDLQEFPSGFSKQVLVVNTGGEYPQLIPVEFVKDKIALISNLQPGTEVSVLINLRGNEYNGKYYANIQGWKIEVLSAPLVALDTPDEMEEIPF